MRIKKDNLLQTVMALSVIISLLLTNVTAYAADDGPKEGDEVTVQFLFTSDTHGSFETFNYSTNSETTGGLTRLATLINQERSGFDGVTYVIDVGDTIQGNGTSMFIGNDNFKPFPNIAAFNAIGYDAAVPGNHEFNFGLENFLKAYDGFTGKKLLSNVLDADGNCIEGFAPYDIFEADGLRIAVIGTVTPNIDRWDTTTIENNNLNALDAADLTQNTMKELKDNDLADIFVAAAHMGDKSQYGRSGSGAEDIAAKNPDLAVILGAHFHTITGTKEEQAVLNGVKYVENRSAAESLGKVLITATYENDQWVLKDKTGPYETSSVKTDVIRIDKDMAKDPAVVSAVASAHQACIDYVTKTFVGTLVGGPLVPEPEIKGTYEGYLQDTALSDLVLNVMMHYTGAEIAGTAPLDTSANAQPGDLYLGDVATIYKFDNNTLYKLEMTGKQIKQWMEWSHSYFGSTINGESDNSKPAVNLETDLTIPTGVMAGYNQDQFAGINYTVDLTKPVGQRIDVLSMTDGTAFDMEKTYVVAANNYRSTTQLLATSPTGVFKVGEKTATLIEDDIQGEDGIISMLDFIIDYIANQPNKTITNDCDKNWEFINLDWDEELRAKAVSAINSGLIETDFKTPVTKEQVLALGDDAVITVPVIEEDAEEATKPDAEEITAKAQTPPVQLEHSNTVESEIPVPTTVEAVYVVERNDNLFKIAEKLYGDGNQWRKIFEANKQQIRVPQMIYIGQELLIP